MPPSTLLFSICCWQGSRAACLGKFYGRPTSTLSCRPWKSTGDVVWDGVQFFALEKKGTWHQFRFAEWLDTLIRLRRVDVVIFLWFKWTGRQSTFFLSKLITTAGKVQDGWWMQMLSEGVTLRPTWKVNPGCCLSKKQRLAHSETPESRLGEFLQARRLPWGFAVSHTWSTVNPAGWSQPGNWVLSAFGAVEKCGKYLECKQRFWAVSTSAVMWLVNKPVTH